GGKLVFSSRHIDQLVVYFTILAGMVALCIQFGLLIVAILSQPVLAQNTVQDMLSNPSPEYKSIGPEQDIAFIMLDKVFGVSGIFGSCISTGTPCTNIFGDTIPKPHGSYPYPIHEALHALLGMYALGIGFISLMIIIYQITTVVGETAASGTPFGRRYNRAWAPVRLIVFFALLAPLNISGGTNAWLNGAQIITLWTAKWGSNVATNAWVYFNDKMSGDYLGSHESLIAKPELPSLMYLGRFMTLVHACEQAYKIKSAKISGGTPATMGAYIIPVQNSVSLAPVPGENMVGTTFREAWEKHALKSSNIVIRFGSKNMTPQGKIVKDNAHKGGVYPACGELVINVGSGDIDGSLKITKVYYEMIQNLYAGASGMGQYVKSFAICNFSEINKSEKIQDPCGGALAPVSKDSNWFIARLQETLRDFWGSELELAVDEQDDDPNKFKLTNKIKEKGWAGAAIWYNTIAQMNGAVTGALINAPTVIRYPEVMHVVEKANLQRSQNIKASERFDPGGRGDGKIKFSDAMDFDIARALNSIYGIFDNNNPEETPQTKKTGNAFIDGINMLFGTSGIYDILDPSQQKIHPLAQLSALGKSMVEHAIRNFGLAIGVSLGEGFIGLVTGGGGVPGAQAVNDFLEIIATVGILMGFILFYMLPFMPFLYFFFGMGEWIKSIFEAVVAMPLWALAHLTIDGNGLPGQNAANGYYLLLEIFIRPVLMFVGLIGSVMAFTMLVKTLNEVFALAVSNVAGRGDVTPKANEMAYYRAPADEFFFTILYTVLCYMIATSCFKLIDSIPMGILRWIGFGSETFAQKAGNTGLVDRIGSNVYSSGEMTLSQVRQGLTGMKMSGGQLASMIYRG
ncbi:MAG TPA: DotA/TraY family protein, partial [Alphaproteobacteria bacterium]|nr:DotA/TraY family protein [Alphaproteobacteria bacterium]